MIKHLQKLGAVVVAGCALLGSGDALGQTFYDPFNGSGEIGGVSSSNGWTLHSGNGVIALSEGSLFYPGLQPSVGNKVYLSGSAASQDANAALSLPTGTEVAYFSALINVEDNTKLSSSFDYFMHFAATSGATGVSSLFGRLHIKQVDSGTSFRLGIQNTSGTGSNQTEYEQDLSFGTTYLVVVKYDMNSGENDIATLWVNPANLGGDEPSGGVTNSSSASAPNAFGAIAFRNGSATPNVLIDEVRVGTTWAAVTPASDTPPPADETAPALVSVSPETGSTNVLVNAPLVITFDENIAAAVEGKLITVEVESQGNNYTIDATDATKVTINGRKVTVDAGLEPGQFYRVTVDQGAFTDIAGNGIDQIFGNSWSFATQEPSAPSTNPLVENFNDCPDGSVILSGGWTQYSVTGGEAWACSEFGKNDENGNGTFGVRMNGFNGGAQLNEDWLISPALNLAELNIPLLFMEYHTKYNGAGLQVRVSTDYSGTGSPADATWADLLTLEADNTDAWKQLENINLSAYKSANTHVAFIYTSTATAASRWTLDNFRIENVSNFLTADNLNVNFGTVTEGNTSEAETFTFSAQGYEDNVVLTVPAGFELSKDNAAFGQSLTYTPAEAANENTVYVRFKPTASDNFSGAITFTSGTALSEERGVLQGSSVVYNNTLDVVTWNLEWFGSPSNGPSDDQLQYDNAKKVIESLDPEIIALQELVDLEKVKQLAQELGYNYEDMNSGGAQQPGFLYKPEMIKVKREKLLLSKLYADIKAGTVTLPDYPANSSSFWASGRLPYMVEFEVSIGGVKQSINVINIHAKANSGDDITQYNRRKYDVQVLKDSLDAQYADANLIILGDYNDDVDESVVPGAPGSSYKMFVDDENYKALTYDLSVAGGFTYASSSFQSFLDHIIISDELADEYIANSISIRNEVLTSIPNFRSTTSDHVPVMARFNISGTPVVSFTEAAVTKVEDAVKFNVNLTLSAAQATAQTVVIKVQEGANATAEDYTTAPAASEGAITLTIPAGVTSAAFEVQLVDDTQKEEQEQVQFYIYNAGAEVAVGEQRTFTLTIEDNDATPTGIADATKGQFRVYPNPVQDYVRLSLPERVATLQNVNLVVYSLEGRMLFSANGSLQGVQQVLNSQVASLQQGLYVLKVNAGKEVFVSRMLKK
ncbi:T9SS-dependent choice-of-anchor J family protein [Pontibacter actiniarum]|uniref:TRAM domain-containing protein n=1 Tax=Pontibacter actiniarum TaxID=323450 RepID=A0A1X9YTZ6_9BACT|nr:choice-of-anchor J domain-containing protein [Pontibacter actiniarum]ARS36312.1 hypothetical protein CA264_13190 [Pontibacter actiniarum]